MLQYRAEFDATVVFDAGGGLHAQGFRVDVPHADPTEAEIAALFVAACRLPAVARIELRDIRVFAEPHLALPAEQPRRRWVELSHVTAAGPHTVPGRPVPESTCLVTPFHRYPDGADLAGLPLERLADLPAVVVRTAGSGVRTVGVEALEGLNVAGRAVLLHTGGDAHQLSGAGAQWLVEHGAALVGIDAISIDHLTPGGDRPAQAVLLAAGIPIIEHLTGLDELPPTGARFTAAPPRVSALGTSPVRAYASMPEIEPHDHLRSAGWLPTAGA